MMPPSGESLPQFELGVVAWATWFSPRFEYLFLCIYSYLLFVKVFIPIYILDVPKRKEYSMSDRSALKMEDIEITQEMIEAAIEAGREELVLAGRGPISTTEFSCSVRAFLAAFEALRFSQQGSVSDLTRQLGCTCGHIRNRLLVFEEDRG